MGVVRCPRCGTESPPPRHTVVRCGVAICGCVCPGCGDPFTTELDWWRWAGLEQPPPREA